MITFAFRKLSVGAIERMSGRQGVEASEETIGETQAECVVREEGQIGPRQAWDH